MLGQPLSLGRVCNAVFAYGQYLEKSFWPRPLSAIYPYSHHGAIDLLIIGLALVAISVAAVRLAKIRPFLSRLALGSQHLVPVMAWCRWACNRWPIATPTFR